MSVGGTPALEQDSIHSLFDKLPLMVILLITTTTILMFLAFGSVVLPIKAAVMSALTLGSTMGVLTWMFVDGHGSGLMNYTPQPLMAPMIGLIIAVIWGLSTDYEVFLVSRMVEARERGMSTTEAIRIGTATTGRLITGRRFGPGGRRWCLRVLRPGDDEVPGVRPAHRAAAGRYRGPDVPGARGDEAAGRRLLVGTTLDETPSGTPRPRRDRAARRAQASRGARSVEERALVGAGGPASRPRPPHDPTHPAVEGSSRQAATTRIATAPRANVPSGAGTTRIPTARPQSADEPPTTRLSMAKNAVRNVVNNATARVNHPPAGDTHRPTPPRPAAAPREEREIESWLGELRGTAPGGGQPTPTAGTTVGGRHPGHARRGRTPRSRGKRAAASPATG